MWVILSVWICSSAAWAEEPRTIEVWKNLFTVSHGEGVNSNSTFLITPEGVIVVDTSGTPTEASKVKEAIREQTELPILYTINTHYHGDHSFGNQVFKESHTIIAHENVRKALSGESGKEHLEVFKTFKIYVGGYHLELIHAPGHTDGDLFIYIHALKTLITGDLVLNGRIPYMGDAYIEDWLKALNYLGDLDAEIYIPGHGEPGGKPVLIAMRHYLIELRSRVLKQIEKGSSLKETQDAVRPVLQEKYKSWKKLEWIDGNIERAYREFSVK